MRVPVFFFLRQYSLTLSGKENSVKVLLCRRRYSKVSGFYPLDLLRALVLKLL